jgi:L-proline amide hydrolase
MNEPANLDRRAALGLLGAVPLLGGAGSGPVAPQFRAEREVRVPARGGKLYVRINGATRRRAPILFIHGGPGSSHWYFLPALALADEHPVILYDQLDSGRSNVRNDPANWTVERFVSEIDSIRGELGLDRLHIVGKSWGGAVGLEYAARRPAGLLSLTLAGPLVSTRSWEKSTRKRLGQLPHPVAEAIRRHERDGSTASPEYQAAIQVFYANFDRRKPVPPGIAAYRDALPLAFNPRLYTTMWGPGETAASGSLRFYNAEPLLPRLALPVMFLTGEYDEMMPSEIALLARHVPDAVTRIVPGAGHTACLDNPESWVGEIRRFTNRYG